MKKFFLLIFLCNCTISFGQILKKDSSFYNAQKSINLKEANKVFADIPVEQNQEEIYIKSNFYKNLGDKFLSEKSIDSAQIYYAKSAFVRNPYLILDIYPSIEVINKNPEMFEKFKSNEDSVDIFIQNTQEFANYISENQELSKSINSFPEAVVALENFSYRNDQVDMEIVSSLNEDVKVKLVRWGKQSYLPWTPLYPDTIIRVPRARYLLKYTINGQEVIEDVPCSGGCKIFVNEN